MIFDLDGVLWQSSDIHARAFAQAFREAGVELPEGAYACVAGMSTEAAVVRLAEMFGGQRLEDPQVMGCVVKRKRELAALWLRRGGTLDSETVPTLRMVREAGYKMALVTGASHSTMTLFLEQLPPGDWFDNEVCGEDVSVGKPAPDIFLMTAKRLKVPPSSCVVVEDSLAGVRAAVAAGMRIIAYRFRKDVPSKYILCRCERLSEVAGLLVSMRNSQGDFSDEIKHLYC